VSSSSRKSGTSAPAITAPSGPPSPSTRTLCLVPGLPRSVGLLPTVFPPEPGLSQPAVGRLPLPLDGPQLVALLDQDGPDPGEDAVAAPALEPAVDRAVVAEPLGEPVPLAAAAEPEDDPVEGRPQVDAGPAAVALGRRRGVLPEDRLDPPPEAVIDLPDGRQRLDIALRSGQGSIS